MICCARLDITKKRYSKNARVCVKCIETLFQENLKVIFEKKKKSCVTALDSSECILDSMSLGGEFTVDQKSDTKRAYRKRCWNNLKKKTKNSKVCYHDRVFFFLKDLLLFFTKKIFLNIFSIFFFS